MEALNIRLDQTESLDFVRESVHGTNRAFQGESSFSSILEVYTLVDFQIA